jgi:hypothetical protein
MGCFTTKPIQEEEEEEDSSSSSLPFFLYKKTHHLSMIPMAKFTILGCAPKGGAHIDAMLQK